MSERNNQEFGAFVAKLRKEKGFTQKQLAQKLFISDKAVSKWERGLSMPDISLLLPLSAILGVTTTELLQGAVIEASVPLPVQQVENLVTQTIQLSETEKRENHQKQMRRGIFFCFGLLIVGLELFFLYPLESWQEILSKDFLLLEFLFFLFAAYFFFFVKETLPIYYDENKINFYSDGIFRLHFPGIRFSNRNWPLIIRTCQLWTMGAFVLLPLIYFLGNQYFSIWDEKEIIFFSFIPITCFLLFIYLVGKRYS